MYRFLLFVFGALAIVAGLLVGSLNAGPAELDLFWATFHWPLGLIIVVSFVFGLLVGLASIYLFSVLPLKMALKRIRSNVARSVSDGRELTRRDD